jgi:hypothetical protein
MLVEFRIRNYRSYRDEQKLSMVAGSGKELLSNTIGVESLGDQRLVRTAAVYGANASGKSTLINAARFFDHLISTSASAEKKDGKPAVAVEPFRLDGTSPSEPCEFEATFILGGVRHQYGFVASAERIEEEWLVAYPQRQPQRWFVRKSDKEGNYSWSFSAAHFRGERQLLAKSTRPDALYLSVGAQLNNTQLATVANWFGSNWRILNGDSPSLVNYTTMRCHRSEDFRKWLTKFLRHADLGILAVKTKTMEVDHGIDSRFLPQDMTEEAKQKLLRQLRRRDLVEMVRRIPNSNAEVSWGLDYESEGTKRLFGLLGPWYEILQSGAILFVDELDASMHPLMSRKLVEMFNSPELNPWGAQLVFTTHDTALLDTTLLRRDQIWFTEKDDGGATHLYSLHEYHPRKTESLQKGYLSGRYGAIPFLGAINF